MPSAIPVIDLRAASAGNTSQLGPVRAATEELGVLQVINHGVAPDLISDLRDRTARLLALPRAEKAKLASPHPYRGWRQGPDDFGRLELERFNVGQFDDVEAARAAGLAAEHLGLYTHPNMWPADDPELREVAFRYINAASGLAKRMLWLYAKAQGLRDTFALGTPLHLRLTVETGVSEDPGADGADGVSGGGFSAARHRPTRGQGWNRARASSRSYCPGGVVLLPRPRLTAPPAGKDPWSSLPPVMISPSVSASRASSARWAASWSKWKTSMPPSPAAASGRMTSSGIS